MTTGGAGTPAATAPGRAALDEPDLFLRIKAARKYDYDHLRDDGYQGNWASVPETQVLRLLIGAGLPDVIAERDSLTGRAAELRVALDNLIDRAEDKILTGDEADEYRKITGQEG